jgi:hypothetical protein
MLSVAILNDYSPRIQIANDRDGREELESGRRLPFLNTLLVQRAARCENFYIDEGNLFSGVLR